MATGDGAILATVSYVGRGNKSCVKKYNKIIVIVQEVCYNKRNINKGDENV